MCKWWSLFIDIMKYEILSLEKNTPGLHEYIGEVLYGTIEIYLCMFCVWDNLIIGNPPIVIIIKMVLLKKKRSRVHVKNVEFHLVFFIIIRLHNTNYIIYWQANRIV